MVALLHPDVLEIPDVLERSDVLDESRGFEESRVLEEIARPGSRRVQLTVVPVLDDGNAPVLQKWAIERWMALVLGLALLMGLMIVRGAQGTPPAASWEGLHEHVALQQAAAAAGSPVVGGSQGESGQQVTAIAVVPGPGEGVYMVDAGDTLWDIALQLRPGHDPRPIVDRLSARNGGSALQIGQQLIIPADLG